jgi:hypothetical protein
MSFIKNYLLNSFVRLELNIENQLNYIIGAFTNKLDSFVTGTKYFQSNSAVSLSYLHPNNIIKVMTGIEDGNYTVKDNLQKSNNS